MGMRRGAALALPISDPHQQPGDPPLSSTPRLKSCIFTSSAPKTGVSSLCPLPSSGGVCLGAGVCVPCAGARPRRGGAGQSVTSTLIKMH